jgi:hypothetical protein
MQLLTAPLSQFSGDRLVAAGLTGLVGGGAGYLGTRALLSACFAAGTPLLTLDGCKPIEEFRVGDLVLSRAEVDADGPVVAKEVLEVFVRTGRVLHLHVGGQVIRTTTEHPFWVHGEGWLPASQLRVGDLLVGHDSRWVEVEDVLDTGEYERVYNLRVADYHTYFVGSAEWGFSVWAHNEYSDFLNRLERQGTEKLRAIYDAEVLQGNGSHAEFVQFQKAMTALDPGLSVYQIRAAWRQVKADRAALTQAGGRQNGQLPPEDGDPATLPARNTAAAEAFLDHIINTRGAIEPLVGPGGGKGKVYLMLGDGEHPLIDGRDYVGKTTLNTVQQRMGQHKDKTVDGAPPTGRMVARGLSGDEMTGLETVLIERGGNRLGNGRAERRPTHEDYTRMVNAAYSLLRGWYQNGGGG